MLLKELLERKERRRRAPFRGFRTCLDRPLFAKPNPRRNETGFIRVAQHTPELVASRLPVRARSRARRSIEESASGRFTDFRRRHAHFFRLWPDTTTEGSESCA